jgi:hypothetical protein
MLQQLPITRSRQLDVRPGGLPGPLLEGVQPVPLLYAKQLKASNPLGSPWKASDVAA